MFSTLYCFYLTPIKPILVKLKKVCYNLKKSLTAKMTKFIPPPVTPNVVLVLGVSQSGKDTVADYLDAEYGFGITHVLSDFYEFLEERFNLPPDSIRDGRSKGLTMPGSSITYSGFLIKLFHLCEEHGIKFTEPSMEKETEKLFTDTVFTGVRHLHEARPLVINMHGSYLNEEGRYVHYYRYDLTVILVERPGYSGYTSDKNLAELVEYFQSTCEGFHTISNDGSIEDLYNNVDNIMESIV